MHQFSNRDSFDTAPSKKARLPHYGIQHGTYRKGADISGVGCHVNTVNVILIRQGCHALIKNLFKLISGRIDIYTLHDVGSLDLQICILICTLKFSLRWRDKKSAVYH